MDNKETQDSQFFAGIAAFLKEVCSNTYRVVNSVMVKTYWQIGDRVVKQEQYGKDCANYGDYLIVNLLKCLSNTFGKGFSAANLWNFTECGIIRPMNTAA
jgi:hypothetical protein